MSAKFAILRLPFAHNMLSLYCFAYSDEVALVACYRNSCKIYLNYPTLPVYVSIVL